MGISTTLDETRIHQLSEEELRSVGISWSVFSLREVQPSTDTTLSDEKTSNQGLQ
jgi:hypothetical protein